MGRAIRLPELGELVLDERMLEFLKHGSGSEKFFEFFLGDSEVDRCLLEIVFCSLDGALRKLGNDPLDDVARWRGIENPVDGVIEFDAGNDRRRGERDIVWQ